MKGENDLQTYKITLLVYNISSRRFYYLICKQKDQKSYNSVDLDLLLIIDMPLKLFTEQKHSQKNKWINPCSDVYCTYLIALIWKRGKLEELKIKYLQERDRK